MSDHFFGLGGGKVAPVTVRVVGQTLRDAGIDARLCTFDDPASGPRYWFAAHGRGAPFDQRIERAALAALHDAGLWPIPVEGEARPWGHCEHCGEAHPPCAECLKWPRDACTSSRPLGGSPLCADCEDDRDARLGVMPDWAGDRSDG